VEWLRELGGVEGSATEIAQALTRVGLTVDAVEGDGEGGRAAGGAVLDVDVPSNRPDCLGHRGVAREMGAALGGRLAPLAAPAAAAGTAAAAVRVDIEDPALCARYSAVTVRGVRVGPCPDWMRRRLERSGVRPRNVIVDITNYVMLETGQPLHAFDLERLEGARLAVRRARAGESIVTLDGAEHRLDGSHLVIADARRPVALAGVMGGLDSEIRDSTRDLVIESARFDPLAVRRTARSLGLRTEGSTRFERGTDPEGTLAAAASAADLMARLAGGASASPAIDLYPGRRQPVRLRLRAARLEALLGCEVPAAEARAILERLEFRVLRCDAAGLETEPPSWRADIACEEDLVEEVARHLGYDRIPSTLPSVTDGAAPAPAVTAGGFPTLVATLHAHGFTEAICSAFVNGADNARFADGDGAAVRLLNPLSEAGDELRRSLLPGLMAAVRRNLNQGAHGVALYETGTVFRVRTTGQPPEEEPRLGLAAAGFVTPELWDRPPVPADLFDLKGALEEGLRRAGWDEIKAQPAAVGYLHPGRAARLICGGEILGLVGQVHPDTARAFGLDADVVAGEVSLAALGQAAAATRRFRPFPRTPAVSRDLALVLPRQAAFAQVASEIRAVDPCIVRVQAFDRYESERLGPDRVGLAVHVVYHHPERTLVSEEVRELEERILRRLTERFGITLRAN
jgi:phenylalanyl-tRNA synthetase beta chain